MRKETRDSIQVVIESKIKELVKKRVEIEPFSEEDVANNNPFGYRLAPMEVWKGSKFERSLVTTLGQGIFEQIAKILAEDKGSEAINQYNYSVDIPLNKIKYTTDLLESQRKDSLKIKELNDKKKPYEELKKKLNGKNGEIPKLKKEIKDLKSRASDDELSKLEAKLEIKMSELSKVKEEIDKIEREKYNIRESIKSPVWEDELTELYNLPQDKNVKNEKGTFDLYIKRIDTGIEEFYSLKTVKPNLDQTEIAKKDMLHIKAANKNNKVYYALPYNPAGEGNIYKTAGHQVPYKLFDMDNAECVLIGAEFWNTVADDDNAYNELLDIFESVGDKYSKQIKEDYFGVENIEDNCLFVLSTNKSTDYLLEEIVEKILNNKEMQRRYKYNKDDYKIFVHNDYESLLNEEEHIEDSKIYITYQVEINFTDDGDKCAIIGIQELIKENKDNFVYEITYIDSDEGKRDYTMLSREVAKKISHTLY